MPCTSMEKFYPRKGQIRNNIVKRIQSEFPPKLCLESCFLIIQDTVFGCITLHKGGGGGDVLGFSGGVVEGLLGILHPGYVDCEGALLVTGSAGVVAGKATYYSDIVNQFLNIIVSKIRFSNRAKGNH